MSLERVKKAFPACTRLTFELVIVFVGVYGAFVLSEYQDDRQTVKRKLQLYEALHQELPAILESTGKTGRDRPFSDTRIVPYAEEASYFYESDRAELKPEYEQYITQLETFLEESKAFLQLGDELRSEITEICNSYD